MFLIPQMHGAASAVAATHGDGGNLWLRVMGFLQILIGGGYFIRQSAGQVGRWLQQWPEELAQRLSTRSLPVAQAQPSFVTMRKAIAPIRQQAGAVSESFQRSWSENRGAA